MNDDLREKDLEKKYMEVLSHTTLKTVINNYPVDARSIGAAIKAYCKEEKTRVPGTFKEAEIFANDVYDYWSDAKPGYHEDRPYEDVLEAIRRYLAFKFVWKHKVDNNTAIIPMLQLQASNMLTVKSALGAAMISAHSHTKNDPRLRPGELAEAMELAFQAFLPIIHKLQTNGELDNVKVKHLAEIVRKEIESEQFSLIEYIDQTETVHE